jgi:AmmeMemoRadiSam system protein B/AmmeMemoRadiSam system protein A
MLTPSLVRPPAVAGMFYPGNTEMLRDELARCLGSATDAPSNGPSLKALIVPHAGYAYSGTTAAAAFARLRAHSGGVRRVVLLGPAHRVAIRGIAVPTSDAFATPLGRVPLDHAAITSLAELPQVVVSDLAHAQEHSLEVQLPFLQSVLGAFTLVPLAVGDATPAEVTEVIEALWGGPETLIVVSSDLSHYHEYRDAEQRDAATIERILHRRDLSSHEQACGALPINGLLHAASHHGLSIECLAHCNSGDTAGDKDRVVGYAAFALYEPDAEKAALGQALLRLARQAISEQLGATAAAGAGEVVTTEPTALRALAAPAATFVTLTLDGTLHGCIGTLEPRRSLAEDVQANAVAAALSDPRFPALTRAEWPRVRVEVSLLSPPTALHVAGEADALRQLRPGLDGVILVAGLQRATFLPQVWEQLPEPAEFLAHLKQKAGFPADAWSDDFRLFRYEVQKWKE